MKHRKLAAVAGRTIEEGEKRVLRALEEATHGRVNMNDPLMEQLKQCPEAFKVGEILGKAPGKACRISSMKRGVRRPTF
jgi:hypothetical protein